ncbi:MAG TPA: hypothetical protein VFA18_02865 [Gemmataceae bacterium]|nr:hypothetical protein [Gemmataceae bacterium]
MNAKAAKLMALGVPLLCLATARAQDVPLQGSAYPSPAMQPSAPSSTIAAPGEQNVAPSDTTPGRLSDWITYTRPDCCGPVGGNGPITYDLYLRTGPVLPFGSSLLARSVEPGWEVDGGGRSLFYNTAGDAAWLVDIGVSYMYNHSGSQDLTFQFSGEPTHVATLHRTWVNVGLGYEWYLQGCRTSPGLRWKLGVDAGGRWGMIRLDTFGDVTGQYFRLSDTIGAAYIGLHTDLEIPCGCCTFEVGFRAEYDYTWSDILPGQPQSDVQDENLLLTAGVRF